MDPVGGLEDPAQLRSGQRNRPVQVHQLRRRVSGISAVQLADRNLVLPNFAFFGYLTLLLEASIGAFLLVGLATRFWAVLGIIQTVAIALSVLNAPDEWPWSYYLMIAAHVVILAAAAGRLVGLDGVLRPRWRQSSGRVAGLLLRAS